MIALLISMAMADTIPMISIGPYIVDLPPLEAALDDYYGGEWPECDAVPLEEVYGIDRKVKITHAPETRTVTACTCPAGCDTDDCGFVAEVGFFSAGLVCRGECEPPPLPESPSAPVDFDGEEEEPEEPDEPPTCDPAPDCEEETMAVANPLYTDWVRRVAQ